MLLRLESIVKSESSLTVAGNSKTVYKLESIVKSESSLTSKIGLRDSSMLESIVKSESSLTSSIRSVRHGRLRVLLNQNHL